MLKVSDSDGIIWLIRGTSFEVNSKMELRVGVSRAELKRWTYKIEIYEDDKWVKSVNGM